MRSYRCGGFGASKPQVIHPLHKALASKTESTNSLLAPFSALFWGYSPSPGTTLGRRGLRYIFHVADFSGSTRPVMG